MFRLAIIAITLVCLSLAVSRASADANIQILASFVPAPAGYGPGDLVRGKDGNYYGFTYYGGAYESGTIFRMSPTGVLTTIHALDGPVDGYSPTSLILGSDGNFYGMTQGDGADPSTIFKVTPDGVFTVLKNFGIIDASYSGPTEGPDGNLYGIKNNIAFKITKAGVYTALGSVGNTIGVGLNIPMIVGPDGSMYGTYSGNVFKVAMDGTLTPLAQTSNWWIFPARGPDGNMYAIAESNTSQESFYALATDGTLTLIPQTGADPASIQTLFVGADHSLYVMSTDTAEDTGYVLKLSTAGAFTWIGSFPMTNEFTSSAAVIQAPNGTFYGVVGGGGTNTNGTCFSLTARGIYRQLRTFDDSQGMNPGGNIAQDSAGNFYGMTENGGASSLGTIFQMSTRGGLKTLYSFSTTPNFSTPNGLTDGKDGALYGTTMNGGTAGYGNAFRITTRGVYTEIHQFPLITAAPGPLLSGKDGNLYGVTGGDGFFYGPAIFRITPTGQYSTIDVLPAFLDNSTLAQDKNGILYLPAYALDSEGRNVEYIYRIDPKSGQDSILTTFSGIGQTYDPVMIGLDGNIYGENDNLNLIYRVTANGMVTNFSAPHQIPNFPFWGLIQDSAGNFYGVDDDGDGDESIFKVDPKGNVTTVGTFDEVSQSSPLLIGKDGDLYGANYYGGTAGYGYIFKVVLPRFAATPRRGVAAPTGVLAPGSRSQ